MRNLLICAAAAAALLGATAAHAALIYQSIPNLDQAPGGYVCSSCTIGGASDLQTSGETFTLAADASVRSTDFTVAGNDPTLASVFDYSWPVSVTLSFYQDPGTGFVGAQAASAQLTLTTDVPIGNGGFGGQRLVHGDATSPISLTAGDYYVFLTNDTQSLLLSSEFGDNGDGVFITDGNSTVPDRDGDPVMTSNRDIGISLCDSLDACAVANFSTGGVPEPASWTMMILGFGLVGAAARRRLTARSCSPGR